MIVKLFFFFENELVRAYRITPKTAPDSSPIILDTSKKQSFLKTEISEPIIYPMVDPNKINLSGKSDGEKLIGEKSFTERTFFCEISLMLSKAHCALNLSV